MMRGIGEQIERLAQLPPLWAVLVNPGRPVETRAVFSALALIPGHSTTNAPHPDMTALNQSNQVMEALRSARNDLEPPARALEPVIDEVRDVLAQTHPVLVRMSGSGASVFALYASKEEALEAAKITAARQPNWWVECVELGAQ